MKAFALLAPEQPASLTDLPDPQPGPSDILVAIRAASVNGFDVYQSSGGLAAMMEHHYPTVIGRDFAGVVEAVGAHVSGVSVGDEALGFVPSMPPLEHGTFAARLSASNLVLASKPAELSFEDAAALPLAGSAALDLLAAVPVGPGEPLLILGATGGVGSLAVQLAARSGASVIATARPEQEAFVRELGAATTIDYSAGSVTDAVRSEFPDGVAGLIDLVTRGITATNVGAAPTSEKLAELARLAVSGELRVVVQATYALDAVEDALAAFRAGTLGKIVLRI